MLLLWMAESTTSDYLMPALCLNREEHLVALWMNFPSIPDQRERWGSAHTPVHAPALTYPFSLALSSLPATAQEALRFGNVVSSFPPGLCVCPSLCPEGPRLPPGLSPLPFSSQLRCFFPSLPVPRLSAALLTGVFGTLQFPSAHQNSNEVALRGGCLSVVSLWLPQTRGAQVILCLGPSTRACSVFCSVLLTAPSPSPSGFQ